jgi:MauM/NapG family ferredoxin protein
MRLKRVVQTAAWALFVFGAWAVARETGRFETGGAVLRAFLRLDPVLVLCADVAARTVTASAWLALVAALSGLVFGRAFCGYVCPMGATLDAAGRIAGWRRGPRRAEEEPQPGPRRVKYLVLAGVLACAAFGVSAVFFVSPLSLATRLYGLFFLPVAELGARTLLGAADPALRALNAEALRYAVIPSHRFAGQLYIAVFFGTLFFLARRNPRFWCRYVCPAGAVIALFSRKPVLVARRVGEACTGCGTCRRACPMAAIPADPKTTLFSECIVCRTCAGVCPEGAVSFTPWTGDAARAAASPSPVLPSRREFLAAGAVGAGAALTVLTGLAEGAPADDGGGRPQSPQALRPPGAVPEPEFLARCVRCGACMRACPTNMLQPAVFATGLAGLFSPLAVPRRGGCQPECTACGDVCPTGAVRRLAPDERMWAKTGTAYVVRQRCLAWGQNRKCLVCDEVCPYGALEFRRAEGLDVAVPHVAEDRCTGCGWCERHCPVTATPAIMVEPLGALRLAGGAYRQAGQGQGLRIARRPQGGHAAPPQPDPQGGGDLPPGFSP